MANKAMGIKQKTKKYLKKYFPKASQTAKKQISKFSKPVRDYISKVQWKLPKGLLVPRRWEWGGDVVLHNRYLVAASYLRGSGIEIGALNRPLKVPPLAKVRYVDRYSLDGLYKNYPEMRGLKVVSPDVVDEGEKLSSFTESSLDFLIANHFMEHCQDPIGTLKNFLRVLKQGGLLYLALPDKRFTFDVDRPITTFGHLVEDHESGTEKSFEAHYREFVRMAKLHCGTEAWKTEEECEAQIQKLIREEYSIHFHVWDYEATAEFFLSTIKKYKLPSEVMFSMSNNDEALWILKKL